MNLSSNKTKFLSSKSTSKLLRGIVSIVLLVIAIGVSGLISQKPPAKPQSSAKEPTVKVTAVQAIAAPVTPVIKLYGETFASSTVSVRSEVGGKVLSLSKNLRDGNYVTNGQELLSVDDFDYQTAYISARNTRDNTNSQLIITDENIRRQTDALASANEELELRKADFERAKKLEAAGAITTQNFESKEVLFINIKDKVASLKSAIIVLKAQKKQQQLNLETQNRAVTLAARNIDNTIIRAPFNGLVKNVNITVGSLVRPNEVVAAIIETDEIELKFTIPNATIARFLENSGTIIGKNVIANWVGGSGLSQLKAKISRIAAEVNPLSGGVTVYASIIASSSEIRNRLRPGLFMSIDLEDKSFPNAIALPDEAVFEGGFVYAVNTDKTLRKVKVLVISNLNDKTYVSAENFSNEDLIVTSKINPPRENTKVIIIQ